jgi:alpha-glucosidase
MSENDKDLLNNELVYLLAEPNRLADTDWIVPGKTTWEWWHKAMLTPDGKADPANGIPANGNANLGVQLYRYYVDFAAANNIEYLTLDAGHGLNSTSLRSLCTYAGTKNVKIILWTWASQALEQRNFIINQKNNGIAGLKIDFFQRNDQIAMTWGHRLAQELADLEMIGLYHGCPVPTGLNRTFPNILNFEAILGNEENFWRAGSDADYHVQFPFIRSLAGPEDYTPGSMRNMSQTQFYPRDLPNTIPFSQGTRAHELAMYVVFDHWLAYLCDAPTEYMKYPDILDFLANIPSVWEKTLPLESRVGEYITIAKRTGKDWYVGGMSSWTAHDVNVDFSFLSPDKNYTAYILKDGNNASNYPTRYAGDTIIVNSQTKMTFNMAKGGGFVIRLRENTDLGMRPEVKKTGTSVTVNGNNELLVRSNENIIGINVYSLMGQLVANHEFFDSSFFRQIGLSGFSSGVYIAKIQKESAVDSLKFIF